MDIWAFRPDWTPKIQWTNAVEIHEHFQDGRYQIKDVRAKGVGSHAWRIDSKYLGFDATLGRWNRVRYEADISFAEELELPAFPFDCQVFFVFFFDCLIFFLLFCFVLFCDLKCISAVCGIYLWLLELLGIVSNCVTWKLFSCESCSLSLWKKPISRYLVNRTLFFHQLTNKLICII